MIFGIHLSAIIGVKDKPVVLACNTCVFWNKTSKVCLHETNVGINYEIGEYIPLHTCQEKRSNSADCGPTAKFYLPVK